MTDSQRQTSVPETAQAKSQQQQGKSQRSSSSVSADATLPLPAIPVDPSLSPGNGAGPGSWTSKDAQQQAAAKQSLKQWWGKFTKQQQLAQAQAQNGLKSDTSPTSSTSSGPNGIPGKNVFGVPLSDSLKYAGVAISMLGADEVKQVYGYIPIVVAKCGQFLKQKATTVEGVFRISGSTRRMKELQDIFDRSPSYGKDVVWAPWSVHDAANVLRRYLNQMPEPVVPAELYDAFRNALPPLHGVDNPSAIDSSIERYKQLLAILPSSSKYLLCYLLDLLNVFARNHEYNLMPASNLAVVFQPGLIRAPDNLSFDVFGTPASGVPIPGSSAAAIQTPDNLSPPSLPHLSRSSSNPSALQAASASFSGSEASTYNNAVELQRRQDEIKINQEVLEFLINHQDHFVKLPNGISVTPIPSSNDTSPVSPTSTAKDSTVGVKPPSASTPSVQQPGRSGQSPTPKVLQHVQPAQQNARNLQPSQQALQTSQSAQQRAPIGQQSPNRHRLPVTSQHGSSSIQTQTQDLSPQNAATHQPQQSQVQLNQKAVNSTPSPSTSQRDDAASMHPRPRTQVPVHTLANGTRSPSNSQERMLPTLSPISTATLLHPHPQRNDQSVPMTGLLQQPQSRSILTSSPELIKPMRDDRRDKQPRKLKTGRTPLSSNMHSPVQTPILVWDPSLPTRASSNEVSRRSSSSYIYDDEDDIPLSVNTLRGSSSSPQIPGATVKRSRTLPGSAGSSRGHSPRSVSSRDQSNSRSTSSPPMTPTLRTQVMIARTAPSPSTSMALTSPIALQRSLSHESSIAYTAPAPVDLDSEYSEMSGDDQTASQPRARKGWRKAFKSNKDKGGSASSSAAGSRDASPESVRLLVPASQHQARRASSSSRPSSPLVQSHGLPSPIIKSPRSPSIKHDGQSSFIVTGPAANILFGQDNGSNSAKKEARKSTGS